MSKIHRTRRQREHQTNELNFLAWMRTAITLIGFGFAIARFGIFLSNLQISMTGDEKIPESAILSQNLGIGLVILGILLIAIATWRYNRIFKQIERGNYEPSRRFALFTALMVILIGTLSTPFVLLQQPTLLEESLQEKKGSGDRPSRRLN